METIKSWIDDHFMFCVSAIAFILCIIGWWLLYTDSRTANDYHNAVNSVERTEAGLTRAGKRLDSAQTEVKTAEKHIQRAAAVTGKLTERTKRNQAELDECEHITDRMQERAGKIESIIRDIESANQSNGT